MDENITQHFSKKILFISFLFLLISTAWYVLTVFSTLEDEYRTVSPKVVFAETQDVQIKTVYDINFHSAKPHQGLIAGTQIKTGELEFAEIVLDNNVIRLDENTELVLKENNFSEYSTYETDLPRLVFALNYGSVWVNAFDKIEIDTTRSSAQLSHSVGIITYSDPMNRVMVVTGSADLAFFDADGGQLATYVVPLYNQVTYVDNQIVSEYARLRPSKLKKELKLAPIAKSVLEDEWVTRNTMVDSELAQGKTSLIDSRVVYALKNNYYKIRAFLTFTPQTKRQLTLNHADTMLRYLLGGIHNGNKLYDAKEILVDLDTLTAGMSGDPLLKELFTGTFGIIGTVKSVSPAYLVKEYLLEYIALQDGVNILRTYLADLRNNLENVDLEEARKTTEAWLAKWNAKENSNAKEFTNQSQMFHRIILSYSDRVTSELLAVFDKTGDLRLAMDDDKEETRFVITEERLEISSALVASFRYLAAKQYLKTSYENLGIDELDTRLASREIFLEHAKLLAQRIEYAEDEMHGAATAIDETDFREYIQQKNRDELLSENLKLFLKIGEETEVSVAPPSISEVVKRFTNARINIFANDITPKKDSPFAFEVRNARLEERSNDGSTITFDATYDFTTNAVNDVFTQGTYLKGNFGLNDLVIILTKNHLDESLPQDEPEDLSYLLLEGEGISDEAMRAQITAQNLAKQLLISELAEADIKVGMDQIRVMDPVTLSKFNITEAYIDNPMDALNPIKIIFEYDSSSKKASNIYSDGRLISSGTISISLLAQTLLGEIIVEKMKTEAINLFAKKLGEKSLILGNENIDIDSNNRIEFTGIQMTTLPLSVDGIYDLSEDEFASVEHKLLSEENIDIESYFTELAYLFVIDFLENNGISIEREKIEMDYPFKNIQIMGYESDGQTFNFKLDISANKLKDITLIETGASIESMTIDEFLSIAPQTESQDEEDEGEEKLPIFQTQSEPEPEEEGEGEPESEPDPEESIEDLLEGMTIPELPPIEE